MVVVVVRALVVVEVEIRVGSKCDNSCKVLRMVVVVIVIITVSGGCIIIIIITTTTTTTTTSTTDFREQLGHLEHIDFLALEQLLQLLVAENLSLVAGVLQIVRLYILPHFLCHFRSRHLKHPVEKRG